MNIILTEDIREHCEVCDKEMKYSEAFVIMKEKTMRVCKECAMKHKDGD